MKALVIYDSVHGNTEAVARAIGGALDGAEVRKAADAGPVALEGIALLVVGSPTHGGRPTPAVQGVLNSISSEALKGVKVATFDTRVVSRFAKLFGYAADRAANDLRSKGADLAAPPEGFIVKGTRGPLGDGELERAGAWARNLSVPKT